MLGNWFQFYVKKQSNDKRTKKKKTWKLSFSETKNVYSVLQIIVSVKSVPLLDKDVSKQAVRFCSASTKSQFTYLYNTNRNETVAIFGKRSLTLLRIFSDYNICQLVYYFLLGETKEKRLWPCLRLCVFVIKRWTKCEMKYRNSAHSYFFSC